MIYRELWAVMLGGRQQHIESGNNLEVAVKMEGVWWNWSVEG